MSLDPFLEVSPYQTVIYFKVKCIMTSTRKQIETAIFLYIKYIYIYTPYCVKKSHLAYPHNSKMTPHEKKLQARKLTKYNDFDSKSGCAILVF